MHTTTCNDKAAGRGIGYRVKFMHARYVGLIYRGQHVLGLQYNTDYRHNMYKGVGL